MNNRGHQTSPTDPFLNSVHRHKLSTSSGYHNFNSPVPITSLTNNSPQNFPSHKAASNKNISVELDRSKQKKDPVSKQQIKSNPKVTSLNNINYPEIEYYKSIPTPVFPNADLNRNANTNPNTNTNNRSVSPVTSNKKVQPKIKQKCIICQTLTQKCCSLCRKIFYCSTQHQQADWHIRHKFECEGRARTNPNQQNQTNAQGQPAQGYGTTNTNKFVFYSNNNMNQPQPRSNELYEKQMDYQAIQKFLELLEQRLVMRSKIINQVSKLNERTPQIVRQSLVKQAQQLLKLSVRITHQQFKPSFSRKITKQDIMEYSSQQWGSEIIISQVGVGLEYYSDLLLMVKMYHLCGMTKQARETIISIGRLLEETDQKNLFLHSDVHHTNEGTGSSIRKKLNFTSVNSSPSPNTNVGFHTNNTTSLQKQQPYRPEDGLSKTKNLLLQAIISLSETYNVDKTSQSAYKLYIKKVELQEGIWEQIYAYFNMGVWYMSKTYFDKSIKSFLYAQELLDSHKKGTAESAVFRADCLFNIGLGYWALNQRILAIQNMQECYRVRMNSIGKNSMESSFCLYHLAKWYKNLQKWSECLQYLEECHRIRKLYDNQPNYQNKIEQIKMLISQVHSSIRKQKKKNKQKMDSRTENYFAQILEQELEQQERQEQQRRIQQNILPKGTVTSRLFRDDKEYVKFNVNLSDDFFNMLKADQVKLLDKLFERIDERMEKSQAIDTLLQSQFVISLDNEQRELFFQLNQLRATP